MSTSPSEGEPLPGDRFLQDPAAHDRKVEGVLMRFGNPAEPITKMDKETILAFCTFLNSLDDTQSIVAVSQYLNEWAYKQEEVIVNRFFHYLVHANDSILPKLRIDFTSTEDMMGLITSMSESAGGGIHEQERRNRALKIIKNTFWMACITRRCRRDGLCKEGIVQSWQPDQDMRKFIIFILQGYAIEMRKRKKPLMTVQVVLDVFKNNP